MSPVSLPTHLLIAHWSLTSSLIFFFFFSSAGLWSPRLKLKISRYNPPPAATESSFWIWLSSLSPQTRLCTVTRIFVQYYTFFFTVLCLAMHFNLFICRNKHFFFPNCWFAFPQKASHLFRLNEMIFLKFLTWLILVVLLLMKSCSFSPLMCVTFVTSNEKKKSSNLDDRLK